MKRPPRVPGFWLTTHDEIRACLDTIRHGTVTVVGTSAGGREISAYFLGKRHTKAITSNYSAAAAAGDPAAYRGNDPRQTIVIIAGIHGHEFEGIVLAANLVRIFETGEDLRGTGWPQIASAVDDLRIIVVPLANPDGRARVKIASFVGLTKRDVRYWGQGAWKNGTLVGYPTCKRYQPLPPRDVRFLGGYPNDDGYNIQHDASGGCLRTPEAAALVHLVEAAAADCVVNCHSWEIGPGLTAPTELQPAAYRNRSNRVGKRVEAVLQRAGFRPSRYVSKAKYYPTIDTLFHCASGALTLLFEGSHGIRELPFDFDALLDMRLLTVETILSGRHARFRPDRP